jgi:hypothetical protein
MSPFVLQQSKKATWLVLKIKHLGNLFLWGVAHNLVLTEISGHLTSIVNTGQKRALKMTQKNMTT